MKGMMTARRNANAFRALRFALERFQFVVEILAGWSNLHNLAA